MHHSPLVLPRSYSHLSVLNDLGVETLGVLDVDGLDVGVELLLGAVLIVTLTRDADTEAERNALDAGLPDLLVQLGVEADVGGALGSVSKGFYIIYETPAVTHQVRSRSASRHPRTIAFSAKARISLMARGALFLKETP